MTRIRPTSVMPLIVVALSIVSTSHRIAAQTNVLPKVIDLGLPGLSGPIPTYNPKTLPRLARLRASR